MSFVRCLVFDGRLFFVGCVLILIGYLSGLVLKGKWASRARDLLIVGFLLVLASATPLANWVYLLWTAAVIAFAIRWKFQKPAGALVVVMAAATFALELPFHFRPKIAGREFKVVYVIGDSISAGIGQERKTWPQLLAQDHNVNVINLAQAAATAATAINQSRRIDLPQSLVLLEIGGNDLLNNTSPEQFEKDLSNLLKAVVSPGRTVVMLELPLYPSKMGFGTVQRQLARKHSVILIPKHLFAKILATPDATIDGIHLSDKGHEAMAEMVWDLIGE